jgi:hypothetical protein
MDRIDSVPHLEALLLMWRDRGQTSSAGKLAGQKRITWALTRI